MTNTHNKQTHPIRTRKYSYPSLSVLPMTTLSNVPNDIVTEIIFSIGLHTKIYTWQ